MKTELKAAVLPSRSYSDTSIPTWVSEFGLEWLYELLESSTSFCKKAARQN